MKKGYYTQGLSAQRLKQCYDIAPPRVRQYLEAEIRFVLEYINPSDYVLELGCGYGRVLRRVAERAGKVMGIDTSPESLFIAREELGERISCALIQMDAECLGFKDDVYDIVIGIQNSISAFASDPRKLMEEAVRVTRPGGKVLFSSYSAEFWEHRLDWFRLQANSGLIGRIDEKATGKGVIVCDDGFCSKTFGPQDFKNLTSALALRSQIIEVDQSSLFCVIVAE